MYTVAFVKSVLGMDPDGTYQQQLSRTYAQEQNLLLKYETSQFELLDEWITTGDPTLSETPTVSPSSTSSHQDGAQNVFFFVGLFMVPWWFDEAVPLLW